MKRRVLAIGALAAVLLGLGWFGGFLLFTRTVFGYVADEPAGRCGRFFTGGQAFYAETDCRAAEKRADRAARHEAYIRTVLADKQAENGNFVPYRDYGAENGAPAAQNGKPETDGVRLIALYLPQFHQFAENNRWHGRGFTEWTNVTAARPMFAGHYQPKLPIDVGFYDLTHDEAMARQIDLAKNYGVGGFAFYYYWFSGKKLMEKPLYNYLANSALDLPFCLNWANENWSKRWDGGNRELLIEQKFSEADFAPFAADLLPFFKDPRYIRVNGRPLFIVYRPAAIGKEKFNAFAAYLKKYMRDNGVNEPYLVATKAFGFYDNPADWGLDAVMEFEVDNIPQLRQKTVDKIDNAADFRVFDWGEYVRAGKMKRDYVYKTFHTVFPRWDNTPRKAYSGALVFDGATPEVYGQWLDYAVRDTAARLEGDERLVFVNAWNEWAEGAMLEPDRRYGYAYLDVTRAVMDGRFAAAPAYDRAGIAVLTGGKNRIEKGFELLNRGYGGRLLISGVRPGTPMQAIASRPDIKFESGLPVELGYQARDTVGNAREVREWADKHGLTEIFAVTSFYHIPRSRLELERELPDADIAFIAADTPDVARQWWKNANSFFFLAAEYTKFLLVYAQYKMLRL